VRVSKGGQQYDWLPPFETRRFATLLRVRLLFYLEANAPQEWRAPSNQSAALASGSGSSASSTFGGDMGRL
jgi:hypothetical protein